jgi:hypothetical protein
MENMQKLETDPESDAATNPTEEQTAPPPLGRFNMAIQRWLNRWHGLGFGPDQWRYYRCEGCRNIVTWNTIKLGGCFCGISNKIRPASLTRWEMAKCLFFPWTI